MKWLRILPIFLGIEPEEMIHVSAKQGLNIEEVLEAIVEKIPPPKGNKANSTQALIFDSHYDSYKGVVAYVRVFEGEINSQGSISENDGNKFRISSQWKLEYFNPGMRKSEFLELGDVGYIATGFKIGA